MKPRIHGRFADVGIPIRVRLLSGSGVPADIGGRDHSHDFTELLLFHGGSGVHRVEGHDYPVTAGDVFVVTGEQTHAIIGRKDLRHTEVHFSPARLRLPDAQLRKLPGYHALFVLEPRWRRRGRFVGHLHLGPTRLAETMQIVHGMQREYKGRAAGYEALLLGRLIELIVFLSREYSRATSGDAQALLRIGSDSNYLARQFRKAMGTTPTAYRRADIHPDAR